jgi:hypothetical protein
MSSLRNFLDKLEAQDFEGLESKGEVYLTYDELMKDLSDALGMDEDFMHTLPHMPEGLKPAGIAQINDNKTPWAVFNIVPFDEPGEWRDDAIGKMDQYLYYSGAERGVVLSTEYVIVYDSDFEVLHDVDAADESGLRRIALELEPPGMYKQQEGNEGPDGRRTQNYVVGEHYEVDLVRFEDAIDAVNQAETAQEKGDTFEDMAELLFGAIPFLRVRERKELTKNSEIDIVVEYTGHSERTIFNNWSDLILVECKNWSGSVGAPQVRDFRGKMKDLKVDLGVLFARNGVSGDEGSDAQGLIRDTYKGDDVMILVVGDDELSKLLEGESFYELLDTLMYERRMDVR